MFLWLCVQVLVVSLTFDIGSMSDSDFFSNTESSSALFVDDNELNPEDETVVLDGSAGLLNRSMPVIWFDERSVCFLPGTV